MNNTLSSIPDWMKNVESLDSLTLEEFRSHFKLYPTLKEAQAKGYVAHHPVPIDLQRRKAEEKYGMKFGVGAKGRNKFIHSGIPYDDSCYRMTYFEHILDHYLMAKELGGEYVRLFDKMKQYAYSRIGKDEKITLESIKGWAESVEEGRESNSRTVKDYFDNMTPEQKEELRASRRRSLGTPEARKHNSEAQIRYNQSLTEEEKEERRRKKKEIMNRPEVKEKMSIAQKRRFSSMTKEERYQYMMRTTGRDNRK